MPITFRIGSDEEAAYTFAATIGARPVAAFRAYLREQGEKLGLALLAPDDFVADRFEARVCPLGLAALSRVFNHDEAVLSILEEAQFRQRRVRIVHDPETASFLLRMARTSDAGAELDLGEEEAVRLLEALGLPADGVGDIPIADIRARRASASAGADPLLTRLDQLLDTALPDAGVRFEWA